MSQIAMLAGLGQAGLEAARAPVVSISPAEAQAIRAAPVEELVAMREQAAPGSLIRIALDGELALRGVLEADGGLNLPSPGLRPTQKGHPLIGALGLVALLGAGFWLTRENFRNAQARAAAF